VGKYYNIPQCFVRKTIVLSPHDLTLLVIVILKKIKSIKIILEKIITKKTMWGNTVAIHNVL